MGKRKNKEVGNPSATSQQLQPGKKKLKPLKSAKKIVKISSKGNSEISEKVNTEDIKNVKNISIKVDGSAQLNKQREAKATETEANTKETIGGLVFMCNSKTKPDCFQYKVLGLPEHRKDFVLQVKPGMRLFLYDFDLKLLYGIFKASSHGGMKLEPAAFNGLYSAQVRFEVERACAPLPYHTFKPAIRDNFTGIRNMFKTELSFDQVKELVKLFSASPPQQPTVNKIAPAPKLVPVSAPVQPPAPISWPKMHPLDRPPPLQQRERVLHREFVQAPIIAVPLDPRSLNEEHITFGLNPNPFLLPPATAPANAPDFYNHPYRAAGPYETKMNYQNDPIFPASHYSLPYEYDMPRMSNFELAASRDVRVGEMLPVGAPLTLSGYGNRISQPVSSRYSFAGPSMAYGRGHAS